MSVEAEDATLALTAGVAESIGIEQADPENPVEISDLRLVIGGPGWSTEPVPTETAVVDGEDVPVADPVWVFDAVEADGSWRVADVMVPEPGGHRLRVVVNGHLEAVGSVEVGTTGRTSTTGVIRVGVAEAGVIVLTAGPSGPSGGTVDETAREAAQAAQEDATAALSGLAGKADTSSLGTAAAADTGDFATAAQGGLADTAVQPDDLGDAAGLDVGTAPGTVAGGDHSHTADAVGAVPVARTVNGHGLDDDVTLDADDVGADPAGTAANEVAGLDELADSPSIGIDTSVDGFVSLERLGRRVVGAGEIANTTAKTNLTTPITYAAGSFGVGTTAHQFRSMVAVTNNTGGNATATLRVELGANVLFEFALVDIPTSASQRALCLDCEWVFGTFSGFTVPFGTGRASLSSASGSDTFSFTRGVTTAIYDIEADMDFKVTVQFSAASANLKAAAVAFPVRATRTA